MDPVVTFLQVGQQTWSAAMVESAKTLGYPIVQMSDLKTPRVAGVDEVIRLPMKVPLMPFRLKHLALCPYKTWLTLDTDILVKKPVADVFERSFDVAITRRTEGVCLHNGTDIAPSMPFNTGVIFSRTPEFWMEAYDWLRSQDDAKQHWWGDQLAVAEIANRLKYHVLVLPGHEFNWTPSHEGEQSEARIWHYKGVNRKEWITRAYSSASTNEKQSPIASVLSR